MRVNYYNIGKRETPKARYEVGTQHDSDNILNLIFFLFIVGELANFVYTVVVIVISF